MEQGPSSWRFTNKATFDMQKNLLHKILHIKSFSWKRCMEVKIPLFPWAWCLIHIRYQFLVLIFNISFICCLSPHEEGFFQQRKTFHKNWEEEEIIHYRNSISEIKFILSRTGSCFEIENNMILSKWEFIAPTLESSSSPSSIVSDFKPQPLSHLLRLYVLAVRVR